MFIVGADNYTVSAAAFAQNDQTKEKKKKKSFIVIKLVEITEMQKFALCPFDFYSGDTPVRGVITADS